MSIKIQKKTDIIFILLLVLIIFLGIWFRIQGTLNNSFAFTYDVGRDLIAVEEIASFKKFTLIGPTSGLQGLFYGPWWYYILTIPFLISQGNPQGVAFFIALAGIAVIPLSYILGKKIGGQFLGLTFAGLLSFSPVIVGTSLQIWSPNLAPIFVVLFMLSLFNIFVDSSRKWFFLNGIFLALIMDMAIAFGLFFIIGAAVAFMVLNRNIKNFWSRSPFILLGMLTIFLPRILFELRHDFLMLRSIFNASHTKVSPLATFGQDFFHTIQIFYNLFIDTMTNGSASLSWLLIVFILLTFTLFYKKMDQTIKFFLKYFGIVIGVFLIGLSLFPFDLWSHYVVGVPIFYIFFVSIALLLLRRYFVFPQLAILFLVVLFWVNINPIKFILGIRSPLWEGNAAVYRNQVAVVDYVYREAKGNEFNYIAYTPPLHDYTWRYLFSWHGEKAYKYTPSSEKKDLFFVIMEPDHENPNRLKDWLKLRQEDGKVIKEEEIKGGIVVQTRIH